MTEHTDDNDGSPNAEVGTPRAKGDGGVFDFEAARVARKARATRADVLDGTSRPVNARPQRHNTEHDHEIAPETVPVTVEGEVLASRDHQRGLAKRASASRREVVPGWMKDRASARAAARWGSGYALHVTAFHGLRLPAYWARLALRSPVGLGRIVAASWGWVFDHENRDVRRELLGSMSDSAAYLRLQQHHRSQIRTRGFVILLGVGAMTVAVFIVTGLPVLAQVAVAAAALAVLGMVGRNVERRLTGRAIDTATVPPLTTDLIVKALSSLGLATLNQAISREGATAVAFPAPITRDGPGFRADIDLPAGVTAGEVIERRDRLASGLRRPLGCVWPEADQDVHSGRLILYVADKSLSAAKPVAWPLAKAGKTNVFEPIPIGVDQRGRLVTVTLMFASGVIGAVPRMGKTFLLRLLALAAALDPRVRLYIYNLKGGSDFEALAPVAHAYRAGDDPEDMDDLRANLKAVQAEMRRRYRTIKTLPKEVCPESKVTDALASDRTLGLEPIFMAFDETQIMFEHPSYGAEFAEIVTDLVKRGPAVGIMVWVATQRPDAKSIPTQISANSVLRLCLKVMGQLENDMILGTSAYKSGVRATMFGRKDVGIAYLVGDGDDPVIVRAAYVDNVAAESIVARARAARLKAGLLTGLAAGEEDPDTDTGSVLDHLLTVWPAEDPEWPNGKVWCDELAARLAAAKPSLYDGWTGEQITAALKPHGIRPVQVKRILDGRQTNKRGIRRTEVTDALGHTEHHTQPDPGHSGTDGATPTGPAGGPRYP